MGSEASHSSTVRAKRAFDIATREENEDRIETARKYYAKALMGTGKTELAPQAAYAIHRVTDSSTQLVTMNDYQICR